LPTEGFLIQVKSQTLDIDTCKITPIELLNTISNKFIHALRKKSPMFGKQEHETIIKKWKLIF